MAERSFAREVEDLKLGAGQEFRGEGILAITKALLECGVSYVAGYQGAPISHLMDVLSDAQDILSDLGVHFESSASEATAAATLAASVMYPIRGAVTFKAPVGINVASDALANLSSGGVTGGALIIIGEDYGEGSSIMQERSHAFAMKSQLWLVDPRPNVASIVKAVHDSFELSEASNTPVMLEVRIRACHVHGRFATRDNVRPSFPLARALDAPSRDTNRIVLPPASFLHEKEKIEQRWPAAVEFIHARGMNETFDGDIDDIGIIMQGGMYNGVITALREAGLADIWGETRVPLYVMNVTYPIVDREVIEFCRAKKAVLMVEEGQPEFIEQSLHKILRNADIPAKLHGKDLFPMAGEYTSQVMGAAIGAFIRRWRSDVLPDCRARTEHRPGRGRRQDPRAGRRGAAAAAGFLHRLSGAADLFRDEAGGKGTRPAPHRRRYRLPFVLDPAAVQYRRHHHGLRARPGVGLRLQRSGEQALDLDHGRWRLLA